jgi:microcystin-dependent protein
MTSPIDTDEQTFVLNEDVVESGDFPARDGNPIAGLPIGTIRLFAGDTSSIADDEQLARGQILSINQQSALFSLLGTTYGGNGIQTFELPNLAGTLMVDTGASLGADGPFGDGVFQGQTYGQDSVTLSETNMPTIIGGQDQPYNNDQPSLGVSYLINIGGNGTGVDDLGMVVPQAGLGSGCQGFEFSSSRDLSACSIELRRSHDGAGLPRAPETARKTVKVYRRAAH